MKIKAIKRHEADYTKVTDIKVKLEKRDFVKLVTVIFVVEFIAQAPPSKKFQKRLVNWKNRIDGWSETHTGSNIDE